MGRGGGGREGVGLLNRNSLSDMYSSNSLFLNLSLFSYHVSESYRKASANSIHPYRYHLSFSGSQEAEKLSLGAKEKVHSLDY